MFANRRMDHTTVEEDLGSVGDVVEDAERVLKLIVVVVVQRLDPCLNFLHHV